MAIDCMTADRRPGRRARFAAVLRLTRAGTVDLLLVDERTRH